MKILSPHRRKMEASRRFGSREFQNKIKKAQGHKRIFDPRTKGAVAAVMKALGLNSLLAQVAVLGAFALAGYFLVISPYFLVTSYAITGNHQVSVEQIETVLNKATESRWLFIPKNHLVMLSKSYSQEMITSELPLVKELNGYKRVWPNKIELEIVERRQGFAFNVSGKNYLIDDEGVIVKELTEPSDLLVVYDQVNETVTPGERLNNVKMVGFVLSAIKQWPGKIKPQLKEVKLPGKAAEQIQFVSSEGWAVFFDINRPIEKQLSNLSTILSRQIPAQNRLKLAYIDLRSDKWAYYCYKDSPCEAKPQAIPEEEAIEKTGE